MTDVEIRALRPEDRDGVLRLAPRLSIGVAGWRDPGEVAEAVRGWLETSTEPSGDAAAFVAIAGGEVAGFVSVSTILHFSGERDAYIGELMVAEGLAGQGIGRRLVAAAEAWATAAGHRCITLQTGAANTRARAFYTHLGYREEDVSLTKVLGT